MNIDDTKPSTKMKIPARKHQEDWHATTSKRHTKELLEQTLITTNSTHTLLCSQIQRSLIDAHPPKRAHHRVNDVPQGHKRDTTGVSTRVVYRKNMLRRQAMTHLHMPTNRSTVNTSSVKQKQLKHVIHLRSYTLNKLTGTNVTLPSPDRSTTWVDVLAWWMKRQMCAFYL